MLSEADLMITSTTNTSTAPNNTVIYNRTNLTYAQVVVSLVTALAQLILVFVQLVIRSTWRHRRLIKLKRESRFYATQMLSLPRKSRRRRIVEEGMQVHKYKVITPNQYNRHISAVVAEFRDSRQDCTLMLKEVRLALIKTHGSNAKLMSMRTCLSSLSGVLPREQTDRFLRIYESVVFGTHRANGMPDNTTSSDIKLMYAFFHNSILKELQ